MFKLHKLLEFCHGNWANSHTPTCFSFSSPSHQTSSPRPTDMGPKPHPNPTICILLYLHPTPPSLFVHLSPLFYLSNINLSSIYPSIHLSTCPSMHNINLLSIFQSVHLSSICQYYEPIIYLPICLSIHPLIYLSMYLFILSSSGVKNPPVNARDTKDAGSIPGSGRSPGGGNDNPLQLAWRILWTE